MEDFEVERKLDIIFSILTGFIMRDVRDVDRAEMIIERFRKQWKGR
jgi:hypothetical protein